MFSKIWIAKMWTIFGSIWSYNENTFWDFVAFIEDKVEMVTPKAISQMHACFGHSSVQDELLHYMQNIFCAASAAST